MKSLLLIVVTLGVVAFLYSCNRNKKCQTKDKESVESISEKSEETKDESMVNSVLNDVYGVVKVNDQLISPKVGMTLEFHLKEGKLNGNGGCNNYGGKLAFEENVLKISEVMATKMACQNLSLEQAFFKAMRSVNGYQSKKGILFLTADGNPVIEARRMD